MPVFFLPTPVPLSTVNVRIWVSSRVGAGTDNLHLPLGGNLDDVDLDPLSNLAGLEVDRRVNFAQLDCVDRVVSETANNAECLFRRGTEQRTGSVILHANASEHILDLDEQMAQAIDGVEDIVLDSGIGFVSHSHDNSGLLEESPVVSEIRAYCGAVTIGANQAIHLTAKRHTISI